MKYCGFDLGKKSSVFCIIDEDRKVVRRGKVRNERDDLACIFIEEGPMQVALEASGKAFWVADQLEQLGHEVHVVDPGRTKAIASARIKHDKLDALILATLCQAKLMFTVDRPTQAERLRRAPFVSRDGLVRTRTKLINLVRSLLDGEGFGVPSCTPKTFHRRVRDVLSALPKLLAEGVAPLLDSIEAINKSIKTAEDAMLRDAEQNETITRLQSIPGVGPMTAACFVYTIRRPERFKSRRQVGSYVGLVPSLYQSGKTLRQGHITKQGHRATRWLVTQAASVMLRMKHDNYLTRWAMSVAERGGRKKAVVALARRLAEVMWMMWRSGRGFEARPSSVG